MRVPKIFYGWWVVLASGFGFSTNPGQFAFGSIGLFIIPLSQEFGWERAEISVALTIFTLSLAIISPLTGKLVDRFGAKEVLVPSIFIFGCLLASISAFVSELWHLNLIFLLMGTIASGATALSYLGVVSGWFNRYRGLAFGLTMAGSGIGYAYIPPLIQYMIDQYGWRSGYYTLAAIVLVISLPLVILVIRNKPSELGLLPDGDINEPVESVDPENKPQENGNKAITFKEVLGQKTFWLLYIIFALLSFSLYGLMTHFIPLLIDRGMEPSSAAIVASVLGISTAISRVIIGFLIDRYFAPRVALVCVLISTIGIILLTNGTLGIAVYMSAILIGISIGAELDLLGYLTSRYFGLGSFGMTYGMLLSAFLVGTSTGPIFYGAAYDNFGSYINILILCCIILGVTALLFLLLPKYKNE